MLYQGLILLVTAIGICNGADIKWKARVVTSAFESDSGTDAGVFMQIYGDRGKTSNIGITDKGASLENGETDVIEFTATDVGTPTKLRVWHDNKGNKPGWLLIRIELEALNGEYPGTYYFECGCWLSTDDVVNGIERIIPLATMDWVVRVTTSNFKSADSNTHVWITITGDKGDTRQIDLDNVGDDFERGDTGIYPIKTIDIGTPRKLRVHTDHDDDWHLDKVVLENLNGASTYTFDCYCWLGKPGSTIVNLHLS